MALPMSRMGLQWNPDFSNPQFSNLPITRSAIIPPPPPPHYFSNSRFLEPISVGGSRNRDSKVFFTETRGHAQGPTDRVLGGMISIP